MSYLRDSSVSSLQSSSPLLNETRGVGRGVDELYPLSRSPEPDVEMANSTEQTCPAGDDVAAKESCPTYYDVLKCEGQFALASEFFTQPLKPVHSGSHAFPWATQPTDVTGNNSKASDSKHHLRRVGESNAGSGMSGRSANSYGDSVPSSSIFPSAYLDNSLPPSVFRLPSNNNNSSSSSSGSQMWSLNGMTVGGRSLRRANQVQMSSFDNKVNLV
ncbi:hypothetical protein FB645_001560 [Coemansia sp. IMI 203386]|nr:hypothetical protein FB645_001560 [Coemansia sp. IMI 203386]